ncbi:MAG: DUF3833 domain-containing protein [Pseudomonadota bacterium]
MNTRRLAFLALLVGAVTLASCASPQVTDYAAQRPLLELDQYFNGRIHAHGIFQKRGGEVVRRFTVVMNCHWEGNKGVLDEVFTYSDGTTERRVWHLTKLASGHYTGRAGDVVGEAHGQESGNAFRWNYTLRLPVDGKEYEVQFDDWMFLVDEHVMLNRATMSKFGVTLGDVLLSFTKE